MDGIGSSVSTGVGFCVCMCVLAVCLLCCFSINRCQCGAALAGQSMAAIVTNMSEKKIEKE